MNFIKAAWPVIIIALAALYCIIAINIKRKLSRTSSTDLLEEDNEYDTTSNDEAEALEENAEDTVRLVLSQIRTPDGTILRSMHVHDYVTHIDKNGETYMLDGGNDYQRRSINKIEAEDISVWSNSPFEVVRENLHRGGRGLDGKQPLTWVPLSKMNDNWLDACIRYNFERGLFSTYATRMYVKEVAYREEHGIKVTE